MTIKLIKVPAYYTSQIFQSVSITFAFVHKESEEEYKQLHLAIKCRDFLGDVVWANKTGKHVSIYSFQYDVKSNPIDKDKTRLSLTFPEQKSFDNFVKNFEFVNSIGAKAGVEHSTFYLTDDPLSVIVEADAHWQSASWKFSLFSFYLKLCSYPSLTELSQPEEGYFQTLTPNIEKKFLTSIKKDVDHLYEGINQAHNYSGFVSISTNQNPEMYQLLLA